ncbi:RdgB/HAM1 family non-canonical purine NTP pyrophosphatase [Candidatus Woesearchaeota archaeon]|nr:RdgB/HAM1 family non-canonical purine NTP pyrophosphatase [Candidatus Woesearchaeota archaeon]
MKSLIFVTGNKHKLNEARVILKDFDVENVVLNIDELQGNSEKIAAKKVLNAFEILKKPCFIDDTSLECNAINGLPGPYIKDFIDRIGPEGIYNMLKSFSNFKASAVCNIAYCDGDGNHLIFRGEVKGKILSPRGTSEFDFDLIFSPDGEERTFAEMTLEEKNYYSHRKRALEKFAKYMKEKN